MASKAQSLQDDTTARAILAVVAIQAIVAIQAGANVIGGCFYVQVVYRDIFACCILEWACTRL